MVFTLVAYALFANTFGNAWTLDDFPVIVNNPDVQSLQGFFDNSYPGRPLRELTFLLDHALFGLHPTGWHIQGVFWHALNGFLIFCLVVRLTPSRSVAWGAALLFLVHPVQVEVVANISHRKDSLTLAFCLLSLLAYHRALGGGKVRPWFLLLALGLWGVAQSAKLNALVLPLVFLGYEFAFVDHQGRFLLRYPRCLLAAGLAALGAALGWFFLLGGQERYSDHAGPLLVKMNLVPPFEQGSYLLMVLKSWALMFAKLVLPLDLAPEYVYSLPVSITDPWVLCSLGLVAALMAGLVFLGRRSPLAFFACLWLGAFWLPTSNLLWPLSYFAADRYLYAPSVGFLILAGWGLHRLLAGRRPLFQGALFLLLGAFALLAWQQNRVWASAESLWTQAVKVSPDSSFALNNLGDVHAKRAEYDQALAYFNRAIEVNSSSPAPYYNRGWVFDRMGNRMQAIYSFHAFLQRADAAGDPALSAAALKLRNYLFKKHGVRL